MSEHYGWLFHAKRRCFRGPSTALSETLPQSLSDPELASVRHPQPLEEPLRGLHPSQTQRPDCEEIGCLANRGIILRSHGFSMRYVLVVAGRLSAKYICMVKGGDVDGERVEDKGMKHAKPGVGPTSCRHLLL